jgi:hypothetical protein
MEAKSRRKTSGGFFRGAEDKQFKRFDEDLSLEDFQRSYNASIQTKQPSIDDLDPIFMMMGKITEEDRHYDCHACGHKSCHDMAVAIFKGLNIPENCIVHAKHMLSVSNNELTEIANDCRELSTVMSEHMAGIVSDMTVIRNANDDTADKITKVSKLLTSAVTFCESVTEINAEDTIKFIQILNTTKDAFEKLNDSVKMSVESTVSVDTYINKIDDLVRKVNNLLHNVNG